MKDKDIEEIFTIQDLAIFVKHSLERFKKELMDAFESEKEIQQHTEISLENGVMAAYKARAFLGCKAADLKKKTYFPNNGEESTYEAPIPGFITGNGQNKRVYYQIKDLKRYKRLEVLRKTDPQKYIQERKNNE